MRSLVLLALLLLSACESRPVEQTAPEKVELAQCREKMFATKDTRWATCPHLYHRAETPYSGLFLCKCVPDAVTPEVLAEARQNVKEVVERAQALKAARDAKSGCN